MQFQEYPVRGDLVTVALVETEQDASDFLEWVRAHRGEVIAFDTETTAGNVFGYAPSGAAFGVRLAQFGNRDAAWVVPAQRFPGQVAEALRLAERLTAHSFAYDSQVVDRLLGVRIEELTPKLSDTIIMSKLVEPHRPAGHALKMVSRVYVDENAADTQEGLEAVFKSLGVGHTKKNARGWELVPIDNPTYWLYAGLDVIYGRRLYDALLPRVRQLLLTELATFEHTIQGYLNVMRRRGVRVDLPYAAHARDEYLEEAGRWMAVARDEYGLENVNSPKQVQEALLRSGAVLTERNAGKDGKPGSFKTGKEVLLPLAGMDEFWMEVPGAQANPLARAIARGKRAERYGHAYLGKFIELADPNGRIHPDITGLQARTSRMAVSDPPLQQLPARTKGDWRVRRAILADEGMDVISADYAQIEFRLLAAMAGVKKMVEAIKAGEDLHAFTAALAYGPDWTKQQRVWMKGAGFGIVYGGGAKGLAGKLGITYAQAKAVYDTYNRVYPEIKRYSNRLQREAKQNGMVMRSPTGRILALDRDRTYAAINYQAQSTAADVLKNALEALFQAGLGDHLLMPVHDELIAQAPRAEAGEVARAIGEAMGTTVFGDMPLDAEGEVYGFSWGHGYADAEEMGQWA